MRDLVDATVNLVRRDPEVLLCTYPTCREYSEAMERPDEETLIRDVVDQADRIYPSLRSVYERGAVFNWTTNRWARGAWAYIAPGDSTTLLPYLHTAEGRIHFAGDHTSPWPGWMQGAIHSGRRTAREIAESR